MITDLQVAKRYISTLQSAETRGIDFNLSLTSIKNLLSAKRCYYTGAKLNNTANSPNKLTIDRIDNTKGYVKGNVVACCLSFNSRKGELTPNDIKLLYKKVIK